MPNITETIYVTNAKQWRKWLAKHYKSESDIWLILPHKDSDKPKIPYNDSVEQALCFGWIDTIVKNFDKHSSVQRFVPRRKDSNWSQMNKERLSWLANKGLLMPEVEKSIKSTLKQKYNFPDDILRAIKKNLTAWKNFNNFSESYRRIRVAYIDEQRKFPEVFEKALANFIKKTEANKQFGYGGIDKYF